MNPFKSLGLVALAVFSLSAAAHAPERVHGAHGVHGGHPVAAHVAARATARVATPRIDARQARQAVRIERGIASGRLTAREATRLHTVQRRIARVEHRSKADGVVTPAERQRLEVMLDRSGRLIRRELRDRQTARW